MALERKDPRKGICRKHGHRRLIFLLFLLAMAIIVAVLASMPRQRRAMVIVRRQLLALPDRNNGGRAQGLIRVSFSWRGPGILPVRFSTIQNRKLWFQIGTCRKRISAWALETGAIGFVLMACVIFSLARQILFRLRSRKDRYFRSLCYGALFSIISLSIHNTLDFNTHVPSNSLTLVTVAALCLPGCQLPCRPERGALHDGDTILPIRSVKA